MGRTILREYETLFAINPDVGDDVVNETVERLKDVLTKMKAELLRDDRWGKRKFSFDVNKHSRGNFVLLHYVGQQGVVEELERTIRNADNVIRFLTTGNGEVTDVAARKAEVEKMVRERPAEAPPLDVVETRSEFEEDDDFRESRRAAD